MSRIIRLALAAIALAILLAAPAGAQSPLPERDGIVANGTDRAYRARTRPPSFIHFAVFPHLIVGHQISDVVAVLGSLNIIAAELDR